MNNNAEYNLPSGGGRMKPKPKILIVEDEKNIAEAEALILKNEYETKIVSDGAKAIKAARDFARGKITSQELAAASDAAWDAAGAARAAAWAAAGAAWAAAGAARAAGDAAWAAGDAAQDRYSNWLVVRLESGY